MKAVSLYTGGKDSSFALYQALQHGIEVVRLVTVIPLEKESFMYHIPNIEKTRESAEAIGIPIDTYKIGDSPEELKTVLANYNVNMVISGAIKSEYQKTKIERVCTELDLISLAPLWYKDELLLLSEMIKSGFEIILVSVSAEGLGHDLLGSKFDESLIQKLLKLRNKYGINISGEGGEYESLVLYAPFFKRRMVVNSYEIEWHNTWGIYKIKDLELL